MSWFNYFGLIIFVIIMIPNILATIKHKVSFENSYRNKLVEGLEQVGRYGCFILMIFNIPYTYFNFWFENALVIYLCVNGLLCLIYCVGWAVFWNREGKAKALVLSIVPSLIFLFSGIVLASIPLIMFALIFATNHILLSYKNALEVDYGNR